MKKIYYNEMICGDKILVVDGKKITEYTKESAIQEAQKLESDVIQVGTSKGLPICKIYPIDKYIYELNKKKKANAASQTKIKTIRFSPNIAAYDLKVKEKMARKFLSQGNTVHVEIVMKGREISHSNEHMKKMQEFYDALSDCRKSRSDIKIKGNTICMTLIGKKESKKKSA